MTVKEEILDYFKDINYMYNDCTRLDSLSNMLSKLEEQPTGEWIEGENGNIKCNQCGCEIRYSYLIGNKPEFPKFCCDCGAKMKESEGKK